MSTRCQVQVVQEGLDWERRVTLYHHTDGYPEYMIPLIKKAYDYRGERGDLCDDEWEKGRAGKVASMLCWADIAVFEPEEGHKLHADIEYYYKIYCVNHKHGSVGGKPTWEVAIYETNNGFWDNPTEDNMKEAQGRYDINELVKRYSS